MTEVLRGNFISGIAMSFAFTGCAVQATADAPSGVVVGVRTRSTDFAGGKGSGRAV